MVTIKLPNGTFDYDPAKPLGKRGGFGQVFLGKIATGEEVAVKKLHLSAADAAHRELRIADELRGRPLEHVVPFIDAGEDADTGDLFIVMARADGSLQNVLDKEGPVDATTAVSILLQIANGLLEVGELVHRDLKPDNVLFHEGKWKIADFGIARFVEDSTSGNTLKGYLSDYYAAPEQWRFERSTHATDVYALGCVAFCLLNGQPPFTKDPQSEHQMASVPSLTCSDHRLTTLVNMCLRKPAESRPSLTRVQSLLNELVNTPHIENNAGSLAMLAKAAAGVSQAEQAAQAKHAAIQVESERRAALAKCAYEVLAENIERLGSKVQVQAPNVIRAGSRRLADLELRLGVAQLTVTTDRLQVVPKDAFPHSGWDVVAFAFIGVCQLRPNYEWTATLWFTKMKNSPDYRWYEASYMSLGRSLGKFEPCSLPPGKDADMTASNIMCGIQFAFGPIAIDDETEEKFHDRWCWLIAKAAEGALGPPDRMPLHWPPNLLRATR